MEYSKIVSVSGLPGLFELINSKTNGAIVRSLEDKSVKFVSSRIHQLTQLESIEIYTTGDNINLATVLLAMNKSAEKMPDEKDPESLKKYFKKIVPDMDLDKVHNSDMKKMVKWLGVLNASNIEIKLPVIQDEETPATPTPVVEEKTAEPAPVKKAASKKKS
jgi:hypothetical protein